jgi:addiction module HigA family antidote
MTRITTHPGEILLEEFMVPLGLSARELARSLDVPHNRISELVAGRRSMTADTALRLEKYFGMEARFWLNLQVSHDLSRARNESDHQGIKPREAA